jgi:hypothetical protein
MRRLRHLLTASVLAMAVAGCASGATPAPTAAPTSAPTTAPTAVPTPAPSVGLSPGVDGIECDLGGHDGAYHIHALVGVKVGGSVYAPPANIGIGTECMYWVHTHATDGIVHVEAPASVSPTLGDFLDLWESTYPDDELLATAREAIAAGKVTVNDQPIGSDPLELVLADQMRIIIG